MKKLFFILILISFTFSYAGTERQDFEIILDASLTKDIMPAWLIYAGTRAVWYQEKFFEEFPKKNSYHYTFQEEINARENMAEAWLELSQKDPSLQNKYLDELGKVYKSGYIKEYVFFYFNRLEWKVDRNNLRMNDFIKWLEENIPEHKPETWATVLRK